jgi:hypothetical protein
MRFADGFNPEWGYVAPPPSFLRTARLVIVAAAVGATAGGAVVFSLVERPVAEETSVAARTLVQPDDVASLDATRTPLTAPQLPAQPTLAHAPAPSPELSPRVPAGIITPSLAASESSTGSTAQGPASWTALAEVPPVTDLAPPPTRGQPPTAPDSAQRNATKKRYDRAAPVSEQWRAGFKGPLDLLRSFTARAATGASPN